MITEVMLKFFHGLASGVFSFARNAVPDPPGFITDLNSAFATVITTIPGPVRHFVPIGPAVAAGTVFLALVAGVGLIRIARRVLSLMTGGGGNA